MENKNSNKNVNETESDEGIAFHTIDELADKQNLIKCYQMQVDDNNNCAPVYLGSYPDVPLPVNKVFKYKKYNMHIVTYVLTEGEIENKLYKIVGVNVFRQNRKNSLCSLDLVKNEEGKEGGNYQLLYNDHIKNTTNVVENLEKFPGKDNVLEYVITKAFQEPLKSVLTK